MATTMNRSSDTPRAPRENTEVPAGPVKTPKRGMGRRAFLGGAATAALCGVGALAAPRVIPVLEAQAQEMARAAVANEIGELEGVSLDGAIRAAELTRQAVTVIVLPLARFVSRVGDGALDLLLNSADAARAMMSAARLNTGMLDAFRDVIISWRSGVTTMPIALNGLLTADIDSAEIYLRALKRLAEHPHLS